VTIVTEEGILLRSHPWSESSRILRILTPGLGIVSVMARGVRKQSSRGRSALDTFSDLQVTLRNRPDRDLHTAHEVDVIRVRRGLGRESARFAGASLLAELLLTHTLQAASPVLFEGVRQALDRIEVSEGVHAGPEAIAASWWVLGEAGFLPELDHCLQCGVELPDEGLLRFSASGGGLLCASCGRERAGARLGPGARRDMRMLLLGEAPDPLRGAPSHLRLLEAFAHHHLAPGRPFRSVELLSSCLLRFERDPFEGDEGST
jgi:DNA repair protein RecO (recombination protein O)